MGASEPADYIQARGDAGGWRQWGVLFRNLAGPAWKVKQADSYRHCKGRQFYFQQCRPLNVVDNSPLVVSSNPPHFVRLNIALDICTGDERAVDLGCRC